MKKTLFAVLFVLSVSPSFAQKIRFSESTNEWDIRDIYGWPMDSVTLSIRYSADTIKGGIRYRIISPPLGFGGLLGIREDTILSKVYVRMLISSGADTTEQVLYDYNLHVGDTIIRKSVGDSFVHIISHVDSVLINTNWHKTWHFQLLSATTGSKSFDVIEGIGCTDDPLFPLHPMNFESISKLLCFHNASSSPIVSPAVSGYFDNNISCRLQTDQIVQKENHAIIIPNPIDNSARIVLPSTISSGNLIITNTIGQTIISTSFQNKNELPIGDKIKQRGIYFFRVVDNETNNVYSGKFVY
jgi:hypothetical protein